MTARLVLFFCLWIFMIPCMANKRVVRVGLLNFETETSYLDKRENIQEKTLEYLNQKLPDYQFVGQYYTVDELKTAIRNREVNFFLRSSGFFHSHRNLGIQSLATLVTLDVPDPNRAVAGTIFVRSDRKDIHSLDDLANKTIVSTHVNNFMTYQINLYEVIRNVESPERFLGQTIFTNNDPVAVVNAVYNGKADVGFLRACMLESILQRTPERKASFRVLNAQNKELGTCQYSTDLYPGWTFAVTSNTTPILSHQVALALLSKPFTDDAPYSWSVATRYKKIQALQRKLQLNPYHHYRSIKYWISRNYPLLLAIGLAILALIIHSVRVEYVVQKRTRELRRAHAREAAQKEQASRMQNQLRHLIRLRSVEQLSSIFAHDLGQILSSMQYLLKSIQTLVQRRKDWDEDPRLALCFEKMHRQFLRSTRLIEHVRTYAKKENPDHQEIALDQVLLQAYREVTIKYPQTVSLDTDHIQSIRFYGNDLEIFLLFFNILKNAVEAIRKEPQDPLLDVHLMANDRGVDCIVTNSGPQLSSEDIERMQQPFSSQKEDGLGLGVYIIRTIVENHHGRITFTPRNGGGLILHIHFPQETQNEKSNVDSNH